ncbi:hypothetical protein CROQUDRAFT_565055 [Cronartium quercuum f. sp. fusiforme G11]|uniref:Uncharacterized protein n=1 Tax=Cronartium quercuum f. sp. fusiforme G11 TaxID=708437 RepID=A0A9P6TBD4_9BASI|nr:hypothetical protein CROQUDRAFT_565055 [Cronartium quercuum f. sp. fusiforme G11]
MSIQCVLSKSMGRYAGGALAIAFGPFSKCHAGARPTPPKTRTQTLRLAAGWGLNYCTPSVSWTTTPRGHFLAKDGPKRVTYRDRCQNDTQPSQPRCKTISERSAKVTALRRISGPVTPRLKRLEDRRVFRRSKIGRHCHHSIHNSSDRRQPIILSPAFQSINLCHPIHGGLRGIQ